MPYCAPARARCSIADFCRLYLPRSSRPTVSNMRIGRGSANWSITLPERPADTGVRPGCRWLMRMADLLEDLAPVGGRGRGRRCGRDDARRRDTDRRAAGDVVVVV